MANDRLYIRCKECGETLYLAKTYGEGYFTRHTAAEVGESLLAFLKRHGKCAAKYPVYEQNYLELAYESDENFEEKDLELAAEEYAISLSKGAMSGKEYCKQDFKAGAEWQKEQMMKDAVEGNILWYMDVIECPVNSLATFNNGDKVKIIIVKEDKE